MILSLTLIEPSAFHVLRSAGPEEQTLYREIAQVADAVKRAVGSGNLWTGMGRFVDYWKGDGTWSAMPVEARLKLSQRLGKVVLDFRALLQEPADLRAYAPLTPPALLICGEKSPGPSRRIVEMLAAAMVDVRVEQIEGAGHMSPYTHSAIVNEIIATRLDRLADHHVRRVA
jgi:pimeloyl-ACP methyl ester carboxylesterase